MEVLRVHQDRRNNGKVWGVDLGPLPLINETVIDRIINERNVGLSYKMIANNLNNDLIPTVLGGEKWYASTVRKAFLRIK